MGPENFAIFFSKGFGWLPNLLPTAIFQEICEGRWQGIGTLVTIIQLKQPLENSCLGYQDPPKKPFKRGLGANKYPRDIIGILIDGVDYWGYHQV